MKDSFRFLNRTCLNCGKKHVIIGMEILGMGLVCRKCYNEMPILYNTKYLGGHPELYSYVNGNLALFKDKLSYSYGTLGTKRFDIALGQILTLSIEMGKSEPILNFTYTDQQGQQRDLSFSNNNPSQFIVKARNILSVV